MTKVAILWHMHQPFYEDLVHARAHPAVGPASRPQGLLRNGGAAAGISRVKVTFNLVPSLLVQLEAFAAGRARDRYLELSLKPAADLRRRTSSSSWTISSTPSASG